MQSFEGILVNLGSLTEQTLVHGSFDHVTHEQLALSVGLVTTFIWCLKQCACMHQSVLGHCDNVYIGTRVLNCITHMQLVLPLQ